MKEIGIIIPVRNLSWMTINLLDSMNESSITKELFHIYIMDNGSTDEEAKAVEEYLRYSTFKHTIDRTKEGIGFVKAVNRGLKFFLDEKVDYIFILNNDTLVTEEWDVRLLDTLRRKDVGIVGPMTSPPDWREMNMAQGLIERKIKWFQIKDSMNGFAANLRKGFGREEKIVDFLAFHCVGFKKEMVEVIGILDEDFNVGLFDDDDFCYRVKKDGRFKIVLRKDVYVHHYHNSTFLDVYGKKKYMEFLNKNRKIFKKKHGFDAWDRVKTQM